MNDLDRQLDLLHVLVTQRATIAGDVIEVADGTWAIHGSIPVDGEVLLAEYATREAATDALGRLPSPRTGVLRAGPQVGAVRMSIVREGRWGLEPVQERGHGAAGRPRRPLVTLDRLERLRADSAGHVMVSVDPASQCCAAELKLLDRVGARLTAALAGDLGGRITIIIARRGDDVVLDLRAARPGSWMRARQRAAIDDLVAELSRSVTKRGGTLVVGVGSFGRLNATVSVRACSGRIDGGRRGSSQHAEGDGHGRSRGS